MSHSGFGVRFPEGGVGCLAARGVERSDRKRGGSVSGAGPGFLQAAVEVVPVFERRGLAWLRG